MVNYDKCWQRRYQIVHANLLQFCFLKKETEKKYSKILKGG